MKMSRLVISGVMLIALGIGLSFAYAGGLAVNVQFPFKAEGMEFPAGNYQLVVNLAQELILIRNIETGEGALLGYTSRLSPREDNQSMLVFEKSGDEYCLSQVYMPGLDGFKVPELVDKHSGASEARGK
jgi:hypothetical protein